MAEFQWIDDGNDEAQLRLGAAFLLAQDQAGLATDGVLNGLAVTQTATASGSVQIAPGACVAQDTVANGPAVLVNSSTKTLDILGANPLGALKRNDLVVFDAATKTIRQVVGTPNASPSDPAMPANAVRLARLLLDPATSSTTVVTAEIAEGRTFTSLFGFSSLPRLLTGTVSLAGNATDQRAQTVTFPTPFASTPTIWLQGLTGQTSSSTTWNVWSSVESNTGLTVNGVRNNTTTMTVRWFAYGV